MDAAQNLTQRLTSELSEEHVMAWSNVGNIKGPAGPQGPQGNVGPQGPAGTNGTNGTNGARGSLWYTGTGAPGTIAGAQAGDQYLDTTSGNVYTFS